MPTYQYRCPACGQEFERFEKMNAVRRAKCPQCGKPAERQISGGAGLVFKGSGFYITDYKRTGSTKPSDASESGPTPEKDGKADKAEKSDKAEQKAPPKAPGAE